MKKTTILFLSAVVMLMLAACNGASFKKTKTGLMYKIISNGKGEVVKNGQFLKIEFSQKLRDSVLGSSADRGPEYVKIDSATPSNYLNPAELFGKLRKGDSLVVVFEADSIRKIQGGLPPFLKAKDKIFLTVKALDIFKTEEEANKDRELAMQEVIKKQEAASVVQKEKDIKIIQDYLKKNNITAQSAPKGTLVEITAQGTGPACDSGKFISVMYTGKTLAGKVFDSNVDPKFNHPGEPFVFQINGRGAITGWSDGLSLFKKGGKGRLFIPSTLGWGKQGAGEDIKADEITIFDVEVVDVSDTQPAPQMPDPHSAPKPDSVDAKPSKKK
jgi:FKBP-type peptidyl-prolyl cis-trans isomerase FkpA